MATQSLGLRLVKRTVNQDDVSAYHLFYADPIGRPGTELTFFEWAHVPARQPGVGEVAETGLRVPSVEALDWWEGRLREDARMVVRGRTTRAGRDVLRVTDAEWQPFGLVADPEGAVVPAATEPALAEAEAAWWVANRYREQLENVRTKKSASETELRSRKLLADAETAEEKLAILRGQHVPVEAVEDALSQFATALKSCLRGLHQLARRLHGKSTAEASQILRQVGNEILHELAALRFTRKQRDRDPDGPPDAA
jgi:catechol 2,3-dioxygenase-like lactoylglutathione lyase family enzyme